METSWLVALEVTAFLVDPPGPPMLARVNASLEIVALETATAGPIFLITKSLSHYLFSVFGLNTAFIYKPHWAEAFVLYSPQCYYRSIWRLGQPFFAPNTSWKVNESSLTCRCLELFSIGQDQMASWPWLPWVSGGCSWRLIVSPGSWQGHHFLSVPGISPGSGWWILPKNSLKELSDQGCCWALFWSVDWNMLQVALECIHSIV